MSINTLHKGDDDDDNNNNNNNNKMFEENLEAIPGKNSID